MEKKSPWKAKFSNISHSGFLPRHYNVRIEKSERSSKKNVLSYGPARFSLILLVFLLAISAAAPLLAPYGRDDMDLDRVLATPSAEHPLGTDELGRDALTRLLYAGRYSILIAAIAVAIATVIGIAAGCAAGYLGGWIDAVVTVAIDFVLSLPIFLVLLVAVAAAGPRMWLVPVIIAASFWTETARVVRSLVFSMRERPFVEAARASGAQGWFLLGRHILPGVLPAAIIASTTGFAQAMIAESAMSFLGFGVQPPVPTWGNMLQQAHLLVREAPIAALAPGFMIFMTCLAFYYAGEGFRRALAQGE